MKNTSAYLQALKTIVEMRGIEILSLDDLYILSRTDSQLPYDKSLIVHKELNKRLWAEVKRSAKGLNRDAGSVNVVWKNPVLITDKPFNSLLKLA